jgi:multidrug efflux pump subunit AcrA (membrane-fusion protein)
MKVRFLFGPVLQTVAYRKRQFPQPALEPFRAGQDAEIKVDTFNFTRYGLLHGHVLSISQDAVVRDRQQDRANERAQGTATETSEPKGQELNYSARISLDRTEMQIDDRMVKLSPGMAVTVEIKTGSRSILSYLLSPLQRYGRRRCANGDAAARCGWTDPPAILG